MERQQSELSTRSLGRTTKKWGAELAKDYDFFGLRLRVYSLEFLAEASGLESRV